jgi:hypothetical protein
LRDDRIRLINGTKCGQYICLSHCWGPPEKLVRTTFSNIKQFQKDIPFEALSKTFQDAVDISRRLGINFLWIDSLCIIQDSEEDWRAQSALMADIYENAFLTIFASKAWESSEGCYSDYSHTDLGQKVNGLENVHIRQFHGKDIYPALTDYEKFVDKTSWPLLTRAWVYQEQHLSRRRLHFAEKDVIWHCETRNASESGLYFNETKKRHEHDERNQRSEHSHQKWYKTINKYTSLALTIESDRLVALAGIVKRMQAARPGDRYLAGLWEKSLLRDLTWLQHDSNPFYESLSKGRVNRKLPSFSWASVRGPISCGYDDGDISLDTVTVLEVHYVPSGPTELGQPSETHIMIKSRMLEATVSKKPDNGTVRERRILNLVNPFEGSSDCNIFFYPDYWLEGPGEEGVPLDSQVLVMFLVKGFYSLSGIAIRKRRDGRYERIGRVDLQSVKLAEDFANFLNSLPEATIALV